MEVGIQNSGPVTIILKNKLLTLKMKAKRRYNKNAK